MHLLPQIVAWGIAIGWMVRGSGAMRGLGAIANLRDPEHNLAPGGEPSITVIVPARNEARDIRACLESLLAQDYSHFRIVAVNDRSTDETGGLMNSFCDPRLAVLHVVELPRDSLGKTHAMAIAARHAIANHAPDYLLFTDADVIFRTDAIRRSLSYAVSTRADHLVLLPTTVIRRWDEAAFLSFFQLLGSLSVRLGRVADPAARDAIGVGAFNMIRSDAYNKIGGFETLRMEIVEDVGLGRLVKRAGLAQRVANGRDVVGVHWASGVSGIVNGVTKNIFAAFRFSISLMALSCLWLFFFCILPFFAVWAGAFAIPAALAIATIFAIYYLFGRLSGLSAWNALLAPFAATVFIYALLRSMLVTLYQGGVVWRGTFYPLGELRRNKQPLFPR